MLEKRKICSDFAIKDTWRRHIFGVRIVSGRRLGQRP
jgi:hypothetical protein